VTIRLSGEESPDYYNEVTDETPSLNYVKYVDFTYFVICMVVQRARIFKTRDFETTNGN
jgi:hypothetical protein